jgi:hypothetical protein
MECSSFTTHPKKHNIQQHQAMTRPQHDPYGQYCAKPQSEVSLLHSHNHDGPELHDASNVQLVLSYLYNAWMNTSCNDYSADSIDLSIYQHYQKYGQDNSQHQQAECTYLRFSMRDHAHSHTNNFFFFSLFSLLQSVGGVVFVFVQQLVIIDIHWAKKLNRPNKTKVRERAGKMCAGAILIPCFLLRACPKFGALFIISLSNILVASPT